MSREIITRRCLPHWYVPGAAHFVTFRLSGTLPRSATEELQNVKKQLLQQTRPPEVPVEVFRSRLHKQLFGHYDRMLDQDQDITWLANPRVAAIVRSSLYFLHGKKYYLYAHCIMPNHVHVLFHPMAPPAESRSDEAAMGEGADGNGPLSGIMHSLKSYTAHEANKVLQREGSFWQGESYDHWVRDDDEQERIVDYIANNPVKARLVKNPQDWFFSSCHDRFLTDGDVAGWLNWETFHAAK